MWGKWGKEPTTIHHKVETSPSVRMSWIDTRITAYIRRRVRWIIFKADKHYLDEIECASEHPIRRVQLTVMPYNLYLLLDEERFLRVANNVLGEAGTRLSVTHIEETEPTGHTTIYLSGL